MLRLLTCLACAAVLSFAAHAQVTGTVDYRVTIQTRTQPLPPHLAQLAGRIPSSRTGERRLAFVGDKARSEDIARETDSEVPAYTLGITYTDLAARRQVRQVPFLQRTFLIEGDLPAIAWRLTDEVGEYMGYPVQKAIGTRDSTEVEAWFAPQIAASVGPESYGGLPGLILVLAEDGGRRTFEATAVSLGAPDISVVPPTEGRRMAQDDFNAMKRERIDALRSGRRSNGAIFIPAN